MASGPTCFVVMSVFTAERFQGNPLAIVSVRSNSLTQQRKALIAKEFNYPETVFIHDAPGPGMPRRLEIFTESGEEIPFAGHPVIGAAHYIFNQIEKIVHGGPADRDTQRQTAVFLTKAGQVPVFFNPYRSVAACSVPHKVYIHSKRVPVDNVIAVQPQTQIVPTIDHFKGRTFPIVSIVKGMTFALVDLTDAPQVFAALEAGKAPEVDLDPDWAPSFVGCMYYLRKQKAEQAGEPTIHNIQARMISHGVEDPGTGTGCCALSCYLALTELEGKKATEEKSVTDEAKKTEDMDKKEEAEDTGGTERKGSDASSDKLEAKKKDSIERKVFGIQQGVEMGRLCTVAVEVDVRYGADGKTSIASVILSGRCNVFSKGELIGN